MRVVACASDPDSMPVGELLSLEPGAQDQLLALGLGYSESTGHPALRSAISGLYRRPTPVLAFAGAQDPIFAFMPAVLAPGDGLIVHRPAYQSLYSIAEDRGLQVTSWNARAVDRWQLDTDALPKLLTPSTKASLS